MTQGVTGHDAMPRDAANGKMANGSCGFDSMSAASTPGSGVSASSHIASRIASLQEKFAAAEQLLQGGSVAAS